MKKISIHSNPEYDYPNKDLCISIIKNIFKFNKINLYDISIIFTSDIFVSDLKKNIFQKISGQMLLLSPCMIIKILK